MRYNTLDVYNMHKLIGCDILLKNSDIKNRIMSDISSDKTFCIGTYSVIGVVALFMTVLNVITKKGFLTECTGIFAVLCVINVILTLVGGKPGGAIAKGMFALEILCMFTFFLVSGNPDGFSAIWICMLPSLGMYFFNRYRGTAMCIAMLAILIFLLWTPVGQNHLMYPYTDTFKMRFPVLFIAFHMLAFLLETLRVSAYKEMRRLQEYYHELSMRDPLTGVYNRQGMYSVLEHDARYKSASLASVVMLDVDFFKLVNDQYGHLIGDMVLKKMASVLSEISDSLVCRWGGEEFVVVLPNERMQSDMLEKMRTMIKAQQFKCEEKSFNVTASFGACVEENFSIENIDAVIQKADEALYIAKSNGRDRIVYYDALADT